MRKTLLLALLLATASIPRASHASPKRVTLEDVNKRLIYLQRLLTDQTRVLNQERRAVSSWNQCHARCQITDPWPAYIKDPNPTEETVEKQQRTLSEACHKNCGELPSTVVGGC